MTIIDFKKRATDIFDSRYPKSILYKKGKKLEKINEELKAFIIETIDMCDELVIKNSDKL